MLSSCITYKNTWLWDGYIEKLYKKQAVILLKNHIYKLN